MTGPDDILPTPRLLEIADIVGSSLAVYVAVVVMVRVSGKRTTGQLNSFDWIISVVVGSLMASGILLDNVQLLDAIIAMFVIALCQGLVTFAVTRTDIASKIIKAEPALLLHDGEMLRRTMRQCRISEEEVRMALRENGIAHLGEAKWVVLETNGELSVISAQNASFETSDAMKDVARPTRDWDYAGAQSKES